MAAQSPDDRLRGDIQWADNALGRAGGLTAAGVFAAAGTATQVVGFAIGDPKLHVKAGLRGLIPLHLRVSARVHHVAFLHPSLDTEFAHQVGGRGSAGDASTPKRASLSKEQKGYGKNLDMAYLCGSDYATSGDSGGGVKAGGGGSNSLETLVLDEKRRLSRDGIVRDHADRKRKAARRGSKGDKSKKGGAVSEIKGKRKFVMLSADDVGDIKAKKEIRSPRDVKKAVVGKYKSKKKSVKSTIRRGDSFQREKKGSRRLSAPPIDSDQAVVFDKEGITGDGPLLASVIMESPVAKIGRYLPETACRVPQCVSFELVNDAHRVKSTQPFVPEAPHIIWGGARDGPLKMVADDGNALVEARGLEYLTDNELDLAERTESLLVVGSTVWVDIPPKIKEDAKTSKDYAKQVEKAAVKGGKQITKGLAKGADATKKGANVIGKAAADAAKVGAKGASDVGGKITEATKSLDLTNRSAERRGIAMAERDNAEEESVREEESLSSHDEESLVQAADAQEVGQVDTHRKKKKGLKKMLKKTAKAMHLTKKKEKAVNESGCELESVQGLDESDHVTLNTDTEQSIISATEEEGKVNIAKKGPLYDATLLPKKNPHYTLVLDDVLRLRVTSFPFNDRLATFPVSVAAILNSTGMEERVQNPRRPSELTVTLVQEPSITEGRWGVEVRVTFRVVEVRPDSPLSVEENPALDEKSGKWHKVNVKEKMKKFKIRLMNAGKSHDEIEAEIKAAEAREEELQEAKEAAIVKAGIGRGYEHGAAMTDIVRRQMFYDPERVAHRQVKRRTSDEVDVAIIQAMAIHGHGFNSEVYGRRGAALSAFKSSSEPKEWSEAEKDAMHITAPLSAASEKENKPLDFVPRADGFSMDGPGVSALTGPRTSAVTASQTSRIKVDPSIELASLAEESSDTSESKTGRSGLAAAENLAVTESDLKSASQTLSIDVDPAVELANLAEGSAFNTSGGKTAQPRLAALEQVESEADQGSSELTSAFPNTAGSASRQEPSESSVDDQLSSETSLKLSSKELPKGEPKGEVPNASQPSESAKSEASGQLLRLAAMKDVESVSGSLVTTFKESDQDCSGHLVGMDEEDSAGKECTLTTTSQSLGNHSVSEGIKGEPKIQSTTADSEDSESASEAMKQLGRRKMMMQSHQAHLAGSGHKVDSLHMVQENIKTETVQGSGASTSKVESTTSPESIGSGCFNVKAAASISASQSEQWSKTSSKGFVDTEAPLGDSHEGGESHGRTSFRHQTNRRSSSEESDRNVSTDSTSQLLAVSSEKRSTSPVTESRDRIGLGATDFKNASLNVRHRHESSSIGTSIAGSSKSCSKADSQLIEATSSIIRCGSSLVDSISRDGSGSADLQSVGKPSNLSVHAVGSRNSASLDLVDSKPVEQVLTSSSERDNSQSTRANNEELRDMRYKMMSQSQGPSGGKFSLARNISKADESESSLRQDDIDAFLRRQRREKLQADYHKEREARLVSAARSIASSPPMTSILLRMSDAGNVTGTSSFSQKLMESKGESSERGFSYYCGWIQPFGEALKAILLEEYPGLLVIVILFWAVLLLR